MRPGLVACSIRPGFGDAMAKAKSMKDRIDRLAAAMDRSDEILRPYREERVKYVRAYLGSSWTADGMSRNLPVYFNYCELQVQAYVRSIVAKSPHATVSTFHRELKPRAVEVELALNQLMKQLDVETTFREVCYDAMFAMGILRMGICGYEEDAHGNMVEPGMPFLESVSFDDFLFDTTAKKFDRIGWAACRYRMLADDVHNAEHFEPGIRRRASDQPVQRAGQDETVQSLMGDDWDLYGKEEQYDDFVTLRDVWLPRENKMLTMVDGTTDILREWEWTGPAEGPFRYLRFNHIPDSVLPLPPVAVSFEANRLMNEVNELIAHETRRYKKIGVVTGGQEEDARRQMAAKTGDVVALSQQAQNGVQEVKFGGPPQEVYMMAADYAQRFSMMNGNLESIAGLQAQSETFKQDQLISAAASKRMDDMQHQAEKFFRESIRDLAFYLLTDPYIELPLTKRLPGVPVEIDFVYRNSQTGGDYLDFNFDIALGSAQAKAPQQRNAELMQFVQMMLPLLPVMQQSGIKFDINELVRTVSKLSNLPEIRDVFQITAPMVEMPPTGKAPEKYGGNKPNGKYERVTRTNEGAGQQMRQAAQNISASTALESGAL
jgi:hypothetical protein